MAIKSATVPKNVTDDRGLRRYGLIVVLVIFGGFGGWAAFAPLSSAAQAPGVITVENYRKTVQHLEGGIIKSIDVKDGQQVAPGQVLVTLEDTLPRSQLEVARGGYYIALAREARLIAQRDGMGDVHYPADLVAHNNDPRVVDAIRVQNQTFRARQLALLGETALYREQISQLREKAKGLRSQKVSRDRLVNSYRGELDDFQALLKEGYTERQKVRELERNLAESQGQSGELTSSIAATDLEINETELKILQIKKDLQRDVAKELAEVQAELFELREKVQSLERTLQRTVIKAPDGGMVLGLAVHTLGAVVPPGGKLLDIVPQNERLIVEAKVSPNDIDRVKVGQQAEVRFSAFKMRDTPKIDGKLVFVSADRVVDEKAEQRDQTAYYLVRVEITSRGLSDLSRNKLNLVAGMPAEVMINTGARTLLQYLTAPFMNTVARSMNED